MNNKYINWVNNELKKIPKLNISNIISKQKIKKTYKNATLLYILNEIKNKKYNALEFGVFKGRTANIISNYVNQLYGFDSFEGLPETWNGVANKGCFKVDELPKFNKNIKLIKGLFQNTLDDFLKNHNEDFYFIHIDCDLYSSTKYVFQKLIEYNKLKKNTIIVFDEILNYNNFLDGEMKALYEINTINNIKFKWIGTHGNIIYPDDLKNEKICNMSFKELRSHEYHQEAAIIIL